MTANNWQWSEEVCSKNQSVYTETKTSIQAGYKVKVCNDIKDFNFADVDYSFYINEARKLIII